MIPRGRFHVSLSNLFKAIISLPFSNMENDDKVLEVKKVFNNKFGFKNTYFLSSCRISFLSILEGLELEPGSEVLMSPITIPDMVNAIRVAGHTPVFVDMNKDRHSLDISSIKKNKSEKTKVVLLTYLSGFIPNVEVIKKYCEENELILVEDFSQLIGATYSGKPLGTFGDYAVASFSIGKTITSQVGGAIIFNKHNNEAKRILERAHKNSMEVPKKFFFFSQLKENIKIEFLTSPLVFNLLTGPGLKVLARLFPDKYLGVHKSGLVSRFNEKDLFFDDIPIKRKHFEKELFFKFNNYMAKLLLRSIREWDERKSKRDDNLNYFIKELGNTCPSYIGKGIYEKEIFPIRVAIYCKTPEVVQLKLMAHGIDAGTYGLNLCHKESVFEEYKKSLPIAEEIHKNCIFISLHEKVRKEDLARAIRVLKEAFVEN